MQEAEHALDVRDQLVSVYGERRVATEPRLAPDGTRRADLGVYQSSSHEDLLLIVECRGATDSSNFDKAVNQVREYMNVSGGPFGMVSTPGQQYIFEIIELENDEFERSIPELSDDLAARDWKSRAFESETEMEFFIQRALGLCHRWSDDPEDALDHVLQNLYRKFFAETNNIDLEVDQNLRPQLNQIDQRITRELGIYEPELSPAGSPASYATICLLDAFSIAATSEEIKEQLVDYFADGLPSIDRFTTPTEVAEFLVDLADVEQGDEMLDPASGLGNLSRQLAARDADVTAVELNTRVANFAAFLNDFLGCDVDIINADFLTLNPEPDQLTLTDSSTFSDTSVGPVSIADAYDHAVVDVPFGNLKSKDSEYREQLQEEFIAATANFNTEDVFVEKTLTHSRTGLLSRHSSHKVSSTGRAPEPSVNSFWKTLRSNAFSSSKRKDLRHTRTSQLPLFRSRTRLSTTTISNSRPLRSKTKHQSRLLTMSMKARPQLTWRTFETP